MVQEEESISHKISFRNLVIKIATKKNCFSQKYKNVNSGVLEMHSSYSIFMPPPLGAGGIMYPGCPCVRACVRESVTQNVKVLY